MIWLIWLAATVGYLLGVLTVCVLVQCKEAE